MLQLLRAVNLESSLSLFLQAELDKRNWQPQDLAVKSKVSKGTISKIINQEVKLPDLKTLRRLARGFEIPLSKVLIALGVDPEELGDFDSSQMTSRRAMLLEDIPDLAEVLDELSGARPDDVRDALVYIRYRRAQREGQP